MVVGILASLYGLYKVWQLIGFSLMSGGPGVKAGFITSILAIIASLLALKYAKVMGVILIILGISNIVWPHIVYGSTIPLTATWPGVWSGIFIVIAGILVLIGGFSKKTPEA